MHSLKRATPWMISLTIMLVCYLAAYHWLYKPRYGHRSAGSKRPIHLIFRPVTQWDAARALKKRQQEARAFCQGNWQGEGTLRDAENILHKVTFQITIHEDTLTITAADHDSVLVGKTWNIEAFNTTSAMKKSDYATQTSPSLKAFTSSAVMKSPDRVNLPWFPFYNLPKNMTYITGQRAYLQRAPASPTK